VPDEVLHELPDEITLNLREAAGLLGVLDTAAETASGEHLVGVNRMRHMIVAKLWPELGNCWTTMMGNLEAVSEQQRLTTPEAGRRLGVTASDVYHLLIDGELEGGPDDSGFVSITVESVERYRAEHPAASHR